MRLSLSNLISDDLADLSNHYSDIIPSDESVRFIVEQYKKQEKFSNISIVHKDNLYTFLTDELNISELAETNGHYQFLIEVGSRSKSKQGVPETIHYCALDLYTTPGTKPLAFVADQYRGYDGFYNEFKNIAAELNIHFAVAGGSVFQADSVHCPVYSINHLLMTAYDHEIPALLREIVGDSTDKTHTLFEWNELSPNYVVSSQSVSMLFNYIDNLAKKEKLRIGESSNTLENSDFNNFLPGALYPAFNLENKIRSKAIKIIAAKMAGEAVVTLEYTEDFTEAELIDICYNESYPLLHKILLNALEISQTYPFVEDEMLQPHPIFELAFSNAAPLEFCLGNQKFKEFFSNQSVLLLMHLGLLDPKAIYDNMIDIPKEIKIIKAYCNTLSSNLEGIEALTSSLEKHPEVNKENVLELLISRTGKSFFQNSILKDMFIKGLIPINNIKDIAAYKINKSTFEQLNTDNERIQYLNHTFSLNIKLSTEESTVSSSDIFSVPSLPENIETAEMRKPPVNIGFLIQSMGKSVFTTSNERITVINEKQEEIIDGMVYS